MIRIRFRPVALPLVCLIAAFASVSCAGNDAATVDGSHLTRKTLKWELDAIMNNPGYVARLQTVLPFFIAPDPKRVPPPFVAQVMTNEIHAVVAKQLLRDHQHTLTHKELSDAQLGAVEAAGNPQIFGSFPAAYQKTLTARSTVMMQLRRALTPESAAQYYNQAKDVYARACEWDIVTKTAGDATAARARVEAGESFQSVARDVSLDKGSGPRGGNLGCNERDNLIPELDEAAFTLPIGTVSQPIPTGESGAQVFHLIQVTSRTTPPLARIKGEIEAALDQLGQSRLQSAIRAWLVSKKVTIASDLGTWDTTSLLVLPPTVKPRVSPTPRPRPLPTAVTSPLKMNPSYQAGQQVFITDSGARPLLLTAIIDAKVTVINASHKPATLRFIARDFQIGPIKPGGSASFVPDGTGSYAYQLVERPSVHGVVQVQWYFDPGEDPGAPNRLGADTPAPTTQSAGNANR